VVVVVGPLSSLVGALVQHMEQQQVDHKVLV